MPWRLRVESSRWNWTTQRWITNTADYPHPTEGSAMRALGPALDAAIGDYRNPKARRIHAYVQHGTNATSAAAWATTYTLTVSAEI